VTEKPLHVRVAEVLGWFAIPGAQIVDEQKYHAALPRYDTDWAATGPLIEKFRITLGRNPFDGDWAAYHTWDVRALVQNPPSAHGETPLLAICNLILALKEAGKLEAA
jgi:hypothetical protein